MKVRAPALARARALAVVLVVGIVPESLVAGLAPISLVATSCGRGLSPRVDDPAGIAEPTRAAVAPAPAPAPSPAAPGYTLVDLAAIQRAVRGKGRPVIAHFWASWCGPCLEELPLVDKFARDMKARGIEVVSLSLDDADRAGARVLEVLAARAPNLTRNIVKVSDSDAFINAIDPRWEGSIPALFAYDEKGQLRDRLIGEASRRDLDTLVSRIANPARK